MVYVNGVAKSRSIVRRERKNVDSVFILHSTSAQRESVCVPRSTWRCCCCNLTKTIQQKKKIFCARVRQQLTTWHRPADRDQHKIQTEKLLTSWLFIPIYSILQISFSITSLFCSFCWIILCVVAVRCVVVLIVVELSMVFCCHRLVSIYSFDFVLFSWWTSSHSSVICGTWLSFVCEMSTANWFPELKSVCVRHHRK